jgi:hypothetical protein
VSDSFPKGFGGFGKGGEGVSHDFDGEELVACKAVEANGPIFLFLMRLKRGEFFLFASLVEAHADRASGFIKGEGRARIFVGEEIRGEEFIFKPIGCENPKGPFAHFHYSMLKT